jgi:hypothetical protein
MGNRDPEFERLLDELAANREVLDCLVREPKDPPGFSARRSTVASISRDRGDQRMSHEAELGFLARSLAIKASFWIGRRSVRLVRALLAVEIRLAVSPVA